MAWNPCDKELAAVLRLGAEARYRYFVRRIVDSEVVWSLRSPEGWVLASDVFKRPLVPVWPHAKYAELCALGDWSGCIASEIALNDWAERWLPGIERDGRMLAVFPTPDDQGPVVKPSRLLADILLELENY